MRMNRRTAAKGMLVGLLGAATSSPAAEPAGEAAEERIRTQVCVLGGGSGGLGAALSAARAGAQVVLVERESILGGTATVAWVNSWEPVSGAGGLPRELYAAMQQDPLGVTYANYDEGSSRRGGHLLPFEPRAFDFAACELLEATGRCQVLLGTTCFHVERQNDTIRAIEAWYAGRRLRIEADIFVDSTADGDVAASAGCEYHLGEDPKSRYNEPTAPDDAGMHLNGLTLCYRITDTGVQQKPYLPAGVPEGSCPQGTYGMTMPNGDVVINAVNMLDGNILLETECSQLMREAQRRVLANFYWLQQRPAGEQSIWPQTLQSRSYATWTIVGVAPRIGVRESRRILGDYILTEHDCRAGVAAQKHEDVIALSDHAIDLHGRKGRLYEVPNGPYGVPYRCLLPKGVDNLLVASRAASFSHIAASSCRLSRTVMTLGQAAGNAAAWAVAHQVRPRQVDVQALQTALQAQGVAVSIY